MAIDQLPHLGLRRLGPKIRRDRTAAEVLLLNITDLFEKGY